MSIYDTYDTTRPEVAKVTLTKELVHPPHRPHPGVNRRTVQRHATAAASKGTTEGVAGPEAGDQSKCTTPSIVLAGSRILCGAFREVILPMLELELSAQRVYQDLVAGHGFDGFYPPVSRFVTRLKASEPERVWRIECAPREELPVDFGLRGAHGTE